MCLGRWALPVIMWLGGVTRRAGRVGWRTLLTLGSGSCSDRQCCTDSLLRFASTFLSACCHGDRRCSQQEPAADGSGPLQVWFWTRFRSRSLSRRADSAVGMGQRNAVQFCVCVAVGVWLRLDTVTESNQAVIHQRQRWF